MLRGTPGFPALSCCVAEHPAVALRNYNRKLKMYCTQCGIELRSDDRFCSRCGARTGIATIDYGTRSLMLDKRNKKVAGVCAGFARYFEVDVILVRVIWLAVALATGVGFLAYLAAWLIMPSDRGIAPQPVMTAHPQAG
jgi:phage shock protein C